MAKNFWDFQFRCNPNANRSTASDLHLASYCWNPPVFVKDVNEVIEKLKQNNSLVYYGSYYRMLDLSALSCDVSVIEDPEQLGGWLTFAFPKGSPLTELVSKTLHNEGFSVNSYLQRLYLRYAKQRKCDDRLSQTDETAKGLNMMQMQGALWVMIYGFFVAIAAWIVEIVLKWRKFAIFPAVGGMIKDLEDFLPAKFHKNSVIQTPVENLSRNSNSRMTISRMTISRHS